MPQLNVKDASGQTISVNSLPPVGANTASNALPVVLATDRGVSVTPTADQDPVYDHVNGVKFTANTTSLTLLTTGANTRFVRITPDSDVFINTNGSTAVDNGTAIRLIANSPEIIPVTSNTAITVIAASGTAIVRATPLKARV